ncbi:MAG: GAF domain-containing SpoIIE family protein phosphatase [Ignavibacteriaceae bacterium]
MNDLNNSDLSVLRGENERLHKSVQELSILNDISVAVSSARNFEEIEHLIVRKCIKYLNVEEGVIMLLEEADDSEKFTTMLRTKNSVIDSLPYKLDDQLMGWMLKNKTALVINNFAEDNRFNIGKNPDSQIKSLLCVPMLIKSRMIGLITLFNKINALFSEDDKRLMSICAAQSAQVIENARLYEQESVLEKLQDEMNLAAQIQNNLLPRAPIKINGALITGKTLPAKIVGGDFYDIVALSDGEAAFWIGDISGKGMPAALLMANIQGVLRSRTIMDKNIVDCMSNVNVSMCENSEDDKYATIFYARLNMTATLLSFISAGHNNPILLRKDGDIEIFKTEDIPIGIYPDYHFNEKIVEISSGDTLIVYSDGIIEAINNDEEQFGEPRLIEIIETNRQSEPEQIIEKIFKGVNTFSQNVPQSDDQTLLIIKL